MTYGDRFEGRNGETKALFGSSMLTSRKVSVDSTAQNAYSKSFSEFLFDIGFDQNVDSLGPARHFWDFLADDLGNLGASAYNRQWRMWPPSQPDSSNEDL